MRGEKPARFPKYEVIEVKEGELLRVAPDGKIIRDHYTIQPDYTIYNSHWFSSYLCDWDKPEKGSCDEDDYMLLLELCGYYGADPETVQYLRDLGYSYTETAFQIVLRSAKNCKNYMISFCQLPTQIHNMQTDKRRLRAPAYP